MTSVQVKAAGERKQEKHWGNLEMGREAFLLPWGIPPPASLSKSLLKYGVSCFNPQRLPALRYLCRLHFFSPPTRRRQENTGSSSYTVWLFPGVWRFWWDKLPAQLTTSYLQAKHLGGGRRNWQVNANPSTTQSGYSCSAAFCGIFNGLFPKRIKALSVSTQAGTDKYLSHDNWPDLFSKIHKPQSEDFWKLWGV